MAAARVTEAARNKKARRRMSPEQLRHELSFSVLQVVEFATVCCRWHRIRGIENAGDEQAEFDRPCWRDVHTRVMGAVGRARQLIDLGVDQFISPRLGTAPGRWTTELLMTLRKIELLLQRTSPLAVRCGCRNPEGMARALGEPVAVVQADYPAALGKCVAMTENMIKDLQARMLQLSDVDLTGAEASAAALLTSQPPATPTDCPERRQGKPGIISGMKWQDARAKAEAHVREHDGVMPSKKRLAKIVGCSRPTIDKVIRESSYLKARYAESRCRSSIREVSLSNSMIGGEGLQQSTEPQPDELPRLIAEQEADERRDRRRGKAAKQMQP